MQKHDWTFAKLGLVIVLRINVLLVIENKLNGGGEQVCLPATLCVSYKMLHLHCCFNISVQFSFMEYLQNFVVYSECNMCIFTRVSRMAVCNVACDMVGLMGLRHNIHRNCDIRTDRGREREREREGCTLNCSYQINTKRFIGSLHFRKSLV